MSDDLDTRRRRATFRAAHRGTKEMDWLLGRFCEARIAGMDGAVLTLFEQLLSEPDPLLQQWIMDPAAIPDEQYADLVAEVKAFHRLPARTH